MTGRSQPNGLGRSGARARGRAVNGAAGLAAAADGVVLFQGPAGGVAALTPEAALRTAEALTSAAREAQTQAPGRVVASDQDEALAKDP